MPDVPRVPERDWSPREALQSLVFEAQMDDGNVVAATARVLREHALLAATSIAHLAAYSANDRVRLQAAEFIVEKTLDAQLDHDLQLQREQTRQVGHAMLQLIRTLGVRYGFDPDSPDIKVLAHEALVTASTGGGPPQAIGPPTED